MDGQLPADHDCVVGAINLGVPRPEAFVEPGRNEVGQDTLELRTTKERDMAPVGEVLEQWRYECYG
jgi:hypothetical protein